MSLTPEHALRGRLFLLAIYAIACLFVAGAGRAAQDTTKSVELAGTLTTPWPTSGDVAATSGVAFFQAIDPSTQQIVGIAVIDISRPDAPSHTATISDLFLEKLYTNGSLLFGETKVGTGKYETHVYRVQGTSQPVFQGSAPVDGWTVYADSQYAIVRTRAGDLSTIDLAHPDSGVYPIVGGYSGADKLLGLTTAGPLAYAGIANGIKILSFGTPTAPVEVGVLHFDQHYGNVYDIAIAGGYAYAKAGSSLLVIDISDPGNPALAATGPIPGFTGDVVVAGSLLYTANSDGLHVYSLANPLAPVEVGYYREQAGGQWLDVLAQGTTVYATVRFNTFSGEAELRVLRFTGVPALDVQAEGPGVTVNGTAVAQGSAQAVQGGDQIEIAVDGGPARLQLRCLDLINFLLFLTAIEPGDFTPIFGNFNPEKSRLILAAAAVRRACASTTHSQALAATTGPGDVSLGLTLQAGGLRFEGTDTGAQVTVSTDEASVQMTGKGQFVAVRPSSGVTTTVLSLAGPVVLTPTNSGLAPVTLNPGDWVGVSASAISPVQSIYSEHIYLPAVIR